MRVCNSNLPKLKVSLWVLLGKAERDAGYFHCTLSPVPPLCPGNERINGALINAINVSLHIPPNSPVTGNLPQQLIQSREIKFCYWTKLYRHFTHDCTVSTAVTLFPRGTQVPCRKQSAALKRTISKFSLSLWLQIQLILSNTFHFLATTSSPVPHDYLTISVST
jgi:hypothetical protein